MGDQDIKRLSRLTAIMTQLQSRRLVTATELAERFGVSVRTIYRDIRALEQAGVPVVPEEGKGYSMMDGYRIPPLMFTEKQANALILAEQLVLKNKDQSFVQDYCEAIDKIKAILRQSGKDKANLLSDRTRFDQNVHRERNSSSLSELQYAITNFFQVRLQYANQENSVSDRIVEPFALISTTENWLLIAWCCLREEFRYFRLDRMLKIQVLTEKFKPHQMTLQQYFDKFY